MKKAVKTVSIVLLFVILIALIVGWILFGERLTAACSVKKLEEGLYAMEFIGDYGFADFLEKAAPPAQKNLPTT